MFEAVDDALKRNGRLYLMRLNKLLYYLKSQIFGSIQF